MNAHYKTQDHKLALLPDNDELDSLIRGSSILALIHADCPELHEKRVSLKFDREKNSPSASIVSDEEGYRIILGPRNYVSLTRDEEVTGQFAEGSLAFNVGINRRN